MDSLDDCRKLAERFRDIPFLPSLESQVRNLRLCMAQACELTPERVASAKWDRILDPKRRWVRFAMLDSPPAECPNGIDGDELLSWLTNMQAAAESLQSHALDVNLGPENLVRRTLALEAVQRSIVADELPRLSQWVLTDVAGEEFRIACDHLPGGEPHAKNLVGRMAEVFRRFLLDYFHKVESMRLESEISANRQIEAQRVEDAQEKHQRITVARKEFEALLAKDRLEALGFLRREARAALAKAAENRLRAPQDHKDLIAEEWAGIAEMRMALAAKALSLSPVTASSNDPIRRLGEVDTWVSNALLRHQQSAGGDQTMSPSALAEAKRTTGLLRDLLKTIPDDPIDFAASQEAVQERYRRLGKRHDDLVTFARDHHSQLQEFDVLLKRFVPDAFLPPPCGSSMDGPALVGAPFSNFSRCFDLCRMCRFELERAIDLVEAALWTGRSTESFVPAAVALARVQASTAGGRQMEAVGSRAHPASNSIAADPKLIIDVGMRTVEVDGTIYALSPAGIRIIVRLADANCGWVGGDDLKEFPGSQERPDRVIAAMPNVVREFIESKRSSGTRLRVPARVVGR